MKLNVLIYKASMNKRIPVVRDYYLATGIFVRLREDVYTFFIIKVLTNGHFQSKISSRKMTNSHK